MPRPGETWEEYYGRVGIDPASLGWGQSTRQPQLLEGGLGKQKEPLQDYRPSYWEDPKNVSHWYDMLNAGVPGQQPIPDWIDPAAVTQAYEFFQNANGELLPSQWLKLQSNDPVRDFLQAMAPPPEEYLTAQDARYKQPETPFVAEGNYETFGLSEEEYAQLPLSQRAALAVFGGGGKYSGIATGAAAAGFEGGIRGGVGGAIGGALTGGALGGFLSGILSPMYNRFPQTTEKIIKAFEALDIPAELVERIAGVTTLAGLGALGSLERSFGVESRLPEFGEVMRNIDDAWNAAHMTYNLGLSWKRLIPGEQGGEYEVIQDLNQPAVELSNDQLYENGLIEIFNRLQNNEDIEDVYADIDERLGFTGEFRDLTGHILADPLNFLGFALVKGGAKLGRLALGFDVAQGATGALLNALDEAKGPVDAVRRYANALQDLPLENRAGMNGLSKWLGGFDETGVPNWDLPKTTEPVPLAKRAWNYLTGLTPEARARETANGMMNNQGIIISDLDNPEAIVKTLDGIANVDLMEARQLGQVLSDNVYTTPSQLSLRNVMPDLQNGLKEYRQASMTGGKLDLLNNIAAAVGKTTREIITDLGEMTSAETFFGRYADAIRQSNAPEARVLTDAIDSGKLNAKWFQDMFKQYVEDIKPYDDETFKAWTMLKLDDSNQKFVVDKFGVEPQPTIFQVSQAIKTGQSIALLSYNPAYAMNNILNNYVTAISEGVFSIDNLKNRNAYWERFGFSPPRRGELAGLDAEFLGTVKKGAISEATRGKGAIQKATDKMRAFNQKFGIISKLSHNAERIATDQTFTSGTRQYMAKHWRLGDLVRHMDPGLEQALGPELADVIYRSVEAGLNPSEIENNIFTSMTYRLVQSFNDELAAAHNLTPSDMAQRLDELHITEVVNDGLRTAKGPQDIWNIFKSIDDRIQDYADANYLDDIEHATESLKNGLDTSGPQEWYNVSTSTFLDRMHTWVDSWNRYEVAWEAEEVHGVKGAIQEAMDKSRKDFQRLFKRETEASKTIAKALGGEGPDYDVIVVNTKQNAGNWNKFFKTRDSLYNKYLKDYNTLSDAERVTRKIEIENTLDRLARQTWDAENALQEEIDAAFVRLFVNQFGEHAEVPTRKWRENAMRIRKEMQDGMEAHRAKVKGMPPAERRASWSEFSNQFNKPKIVELMQTNITELAKLYDQLTGRVAPAVDEGLQARKNAIYEVANKFSIPSVTETGAKLDDWILNIINKHGFEGKAYNHLDEVDPAVAEAALIEWSRAKATASPMFKKWFADSKVVDADGKPLVVYHGTRADFPGFDEAFAKTRDYDVRGFYFSTDPDYAGFFAEGIGGNIQPVYLKADNPFYVPKGGEGLPEMLGVELPPGDEWMTSDVFRNRVRELGYDAIIFDEGQGIAKAQEIIVFEPTQIKSVFNPGTWSPEDPSLRDIYTTAELGQRLRQAQPPPATAAMGAVEALDKSTPIFRMSMEGYSEMRPILDDLRGRLMSPEGRRPEGLKNAQVDEVVLDQVRSYLAGVYGDLSDAKMRAVRYGEFRKDMAMLNYDRRYGMDNIMEMIFPYQFWYTRSGMNWFMRTIDRPTYLTNWARFRQFQAQQERQEGAPSRLGGKVSYKTRIPFMPDWAGGTLYFDPLRQLMPAEFMLNPFLRMADEGGQVNKRAEYILEEMVEAEEITAQQMNQAIETQQGEAWEKALEQARMELDKGIANPFDFARTAIGASLPIQIMYDWVRGRKDKIGQLPITKALQAVTAPFTPGGVNIEGGIRNAAGLPERGEFWDFFVQRELSNMATETDNPDEIKELMRVGVEADEESPYFQEAMRRTGWVQAWKFLLSSVGLDFFPEGEQKQRTLQQEYWNAVQGGDVAEFYQAHPEYKNRLMAMRDWNDEEARLRTWAINELWGHWFDENTPSIHKKQMQEQFGDEFQTKFLDKETRDIPSIETSTLTGWVKAMGGYVPEGAEAEQFDLDLAQPDETQLIDWYYNTRPQIYGENIGAISQTYWALNNLDKNRAREYLKQHPELNKGVNGYPGYWDWNRAFKQQYPQLAEMMNYNEKQELADAIQIDQFQPQVQMDLMLYFNGNQPMTAATRKYLYWEWEKRGKIGEDFDAWLSLLQSVYLFPVGNVGY